MRDDLETGLQSFVTAHLPSSDAAWLPVKTCFEIQNAARKTQLDKAHMEMSMEKILEAIAELI